MFGGIQFAALCAALACDSSRGVLGRIAMAAFVPGIVAGALCARSERERAIRRIGFIVAIASAAIYVLMLTVGLQLPDE